MGAPGKESLFSKNNLQIATAAGILFAACGLGARLQMDNTYPLDPQSTAPITDTLSGCTTIEPGMTAGQIFMSSGAPFGADTTLSVHQVGDGHSGAVLSYTIVDSAALNGVNVVLFEGDVVCVDF